MKRVTRTFKKSGTDYRSKDSFGNTVKRTFEPENKFPYNEGGLDTEVKLGRLDLEKLGMPTKIRVTITVVE